MRADQAVVVSWDLSLALLRTAAWGVALVDTVTSRLAATLAVDLTLGGTRRIDQPSRAAGTVFLDDGAGNLHIRTAKFELAYRLTSTARLLLGAERRGYLGMGVRLGYRMQVAGARDEIIVTHSVNPDASPSDYVHEFPQGFTAEALLEGGVTLGRSRRASLGVVAGAGRPRFRAEVVMSFPFAIGAR